MPKKVTKPEPEEKKLKTGEIIVKRGKFLVQFN